ncbi:GDCCVxC domain-containing (seleno)protein [Brevundimonas sp.]|uniref:GDCCVxC domain-containing (seleno)protein n=1 Tax=Brevundimonas naejangsanensis TaxID=588932 RepID=UPI0028A242F5|nr:GDCCVxC domain-containing (seleno)protein [Brevundimonas sp.]
MKLKPLPGDCCVFCSYADVPCPPIQEDGKSCCGWRSSGSFLEEPRRQIQADADAPIFR